MSATTRSWPRTAEFDAFGPWVDLVRTPDEVPPVFRSHPLDLTAAELVLKVPRDIPRRDANPGMHLYDHLLIAGGWGLTVLRRRGDGYTVRDVPYNDLAAVEYGTELLAGWLTVHGRESAPVTVAFNGSSVDVVARLVRVLRRNAGHGAVDRPLPAAPTPPPLRMDDLGRDDAGLVSEQLAVLRSEPDMRLLAAYGRRTVVASGALARLAALVGRRTVLQGAVLLASEREVHLVHRRGFVTVGRRPVHSLAHLVLLRGRIDGAVVVDQDGLRGVRQVEVVAGRTTLRVPAPQEADLPTALRGLLGR